MYSDAAKFKQAGEDMHMAMTKIAAAAKGGNEGDIKAAIGAAGKTCAACHDNFRQKN